MARRMVLRNFRVVDENTDMTGSVLIEDGIIREVSAGAVDDGAAAVIIDGRELLSGQSDAESPPLLMPAFIDLHAHFRDPLSGKNLPPETIESACLAAAAGGFGTVVCMANTKPPVDTAEKALVLKKRSDALGLIDLYPVLSLTKNMEGKELSGITGLRPCADPRRTAGEGTYVPLMLSEDGRDVHDGGLFLAAMKEARRLGIPVSCHCDAGGAEAEEAKAAGKPRAVWSRIEENNAVRRAIETGREAGCHVHIAHVSTGEAAEMIRRAKASAGRNGTGFTLTAEAAPHHIALTEEDAERLGGESFGRVNPPLRTEADRQALIAAIVDGTIDAIAADHAPHSETDKEGGAPGFTGLETSFAVCYTELVLPAPAGACIGASRLSALMSAAPARISGLGDRGRIAAGFRADLAIAGINSPWEINAGGFKSRGKNTPFAGRKLHGRILMTIHQGRVVYEGGC
jgi:dihydroorotase